MLVMRAAIILTLLLAGCAQTSQTRVGSVVDHPVPQAAAQCAAQPDAAGCASARAHE
jgi:hypothetical protein